MKTKISLLYREGRLTAAGAVNALCRSWVNETDVLGMAGEEQGLAICKAAKIQQSKAALEAYLQAHPLQWTDGEYYAITGEKQRQLTGKILSATMAQTLSADYTLTWNSTGEVCRAWTLADLSALAFAIDARVTKLVSYQQTQEVAMRAAVTLEELDAIEVDYDTVP